jgi:hypothetical protein
VNDEQADDEQADADEDLKATFLCFEGDLTGGGEQEDERERVEAVHGPVRLGLREREDEGDGSDDREYLRPGVDERDWDRSRDADRGADRLPFAPVAGGACCFEPVTDEISDWMPTHEHFPRSKREGGHRDVDNTILAHRLCNRIDYSISAGRPYARDLERIREAREEASRRHNERP